MAMTGSQNRSAAATAPSSGLGLTSLGLASPFINVGHAAPGGRVPLPKFVRRRSPLTRTSESKGHSQFKTSLAIGSGFRDHRDTKGGCNLLRPLSNDREQPAPAHRPWPKPELPRLLALGNGEEDDLGTAHQVF